MSSLKMRVFGHCIGDLTSFHHWEISSQCNTWFVFWIFENPLWAILTTVLKWSYQDQPEIVTIIIWKQNRNYALPLFLKEFTFITERYGILFILKDHYFEEYTRYSYKNRCWSVISFHKVERVRLCFFLTVLISAPDYDLLGPLG